MLVSVLLLFFFFQAEDGIRDLTVTGVQTCALPIWGRQREHRCEHRALPSPCHSSASTGFIAAAAVLTAAATSPAHAGSPSATKSADRKSTRLNSSHSQISYAVFCLKKNKIYST